MKLVLSTTLIIFYNSFTIKLRVVSLRTKYLGVAVTPQLFDIEILSQCLCIPVSPK